MSNQNIHYKKAEEFVEKNDHLKAIKFFSLAIDEEPGNPDLYSLRGVSYFHINDKRKALDDMNKARELQPDYSYRYASRAFIRDSMGDVRGAVEDYKIAVKLDPDDAIAHNNLGILEEKLGYLDKAKTHFHTADKLAKAQDLNRENPYYSSKDKQEPINIQKEIEKSRENKSLWGEMTEVFTSRKAMKDFITFIRKGFKK